MYKFRTKHLLVCALSAAPVIAGTPAIGIAVSQGNFVLNNIKTPGNASVFDGNLLQTSDAPSQVRLKDGTQIRFAADSAGRVYKDHLELQGGSASVSGNAAVANGLSVRPEAGAAATLTVQGKTLEVAAVSGKVHVFNAQGVNVANLNPGSALDLRSDVQAASTSALTGCAVRQGTDLVLTDETSNVTVRLSGTPVLTGKRVRLSGSIASIEQGKDVGEVMKVAEVKEIAGLCQPSMTASAHAPASNGMPSVTGTVPTATVAAAGAATNASGAATVAASVGLSNSTAVVAGVAAATATVNTSSVVSAANSTGGLGTTLSGKPVCLSPCTF